MEHSTPTWLKDLFIPKQWWLKVSANDFPANVIEWRKVLAKKIRVIPEHGMWPDAGYINQDGL